MRESRARMDEVRNSLSLRQVELSVEKCPLCKLTRIRTTCSCIEQALEYQPRRHLSAVTGEFHHVLAGR